MLKQRVMHKQSVLNKVLYFYLYTIKRRITSGYTGEQRNTSRHDLCSSGIHRDQSYQHRATPWLSVMQPGSHREESVLFSGLYLDITGNMKTHNFIFLNSTVYPIIAII